MSNNDMVLRLFRRLCFLAKRKAKALGLREQHVYQRLEDGSYELRIWMIPTGEGSVADGVNGVIVNRTRGVRRI